MAVDAKSNEIPAARTLLRHLDLDNAVVTLDAMHTQTDTATTITSAGGDYVFTVKANMPTLHQKLKTLPWKDMPAYTTRTAERGRRITRTIKVADVPEWIDFPGAAQVAQLRRTVTDKGSKTVEVVYLITSANHTAAPPQRLAAWVQGHWSIGRVAPAHRCAGAPSEPRERVSPHTAQASPEGVAGAGVLPR